MVLRGRRQGGLGRGMLGLGEQSRDAAFDLAANQIVLKLCERWADCVRCRCHVHAVTERDHRNLRWCSERRRQRCRSSSTR